jgi:hypothetical protein
MNGLMNIRIENVWKGDHEPNKPNLGRAGDGMDATKKALDLGDDLDRFLDCDRRGDTASKDVSIDIDRAGSAASISGAADPIV